MQIGSANTAQSVEQATRSAQMVNELNQKIVDSSQELGGKMMKMAVSGKVAATKLESTGNALNVLA